MLRWGSSTKQFEKCHGLQDSTNYFASAKQKSLFYKGLNLYNMLPFDVKNKINCNVFRKKV